MLVRFLGVGFCLFLLSACDSERVDEGRNISFKEVKAGFEQRDQVLAQIIKHLGDLEQKFDQELKKNDKPTPTLTN